MSKEREALYLETLRKAWHERGLVRGWEPPDMRHPFILWAVENGYLKITDSRCMFEKFKDNFVVWTKAGKKAMQNA